MFCTSEKEPEKEYNIEPDSETQKLINKGYLTVTGSGVLVCSPSIDFVFCKNDDANFVILSPDFKWEEEVKARENNASYNIDNYYPNCN